ncbi:hypothetical protein ACUXI4_000509 [Pantoea piersonii]|jgi:hypothetical protein
MEEISGKGKPTPQAGRDLQYKIKAFGVGC